MVSSAMESRAVMAYLETGNELSANTNRGKELESMSVVLKIRKLMIVGLGWCLVMLVAAGCEKDAEVGVTVATDAPLVEKPAQQIFDYRWIESHAGVKQWILESDEMRKFTGQRDALLFDVHMDFFQDGEHFSVLTADSGSVNQHTNNVHTWSQVVIITDDGRKLETEDLYFNSETELIHNEVFNRFTRQTDVMTGIGLEATPDLEYIELKHDVQAEVEDGSDLAGEVQNNNHTEGDQP